ncbi:Bax inhibitor-1 family protein [Achromobacter xylosoxidans]
MGFDDGEAIAIAGRPPMSAAVRKTLFNTFLTVAVMLLITAGASVAMIGKTMSLGGMLGLFVVAIVLIFVLRAASKSALGLVVLAAFSGVMGALLGPAMTVHMAIVNGAQNVAMAVGLTAVVVFSCAVYTITTRRDFSHLRAMLFAGLIVLLLALVVNLFLAIPALSLVLSIIGALLFTGWLLFDLSEVINGRETNYILASINVYLDTLNIFIHLLNILGIVNKD